VRNVGNSQAAGVIVSSTKGFQNEGGSRQTGAQIEESTQAEDFQEINQ
jgi:hypothetical protein